MSFGANEPAASLNIARVSAGGTWLGNIGLTFVPGDPVMNPVDGTLRVSGYDNHVVKHIPTTGTVLGDFDTGLTGRYWRHRPSAG